MRKILLILVLAIQTASLIRAQSAANFGSTWIQGWGVDYKTVFNGNQKTNFIFDTLGAYLADGNSCISDSFGNLVMYSDGCNIYGNNKSYLDGGDTLYPHMEYDNINGWSSASQTSIFLPFDSSVYYFINTAVSDSLFSLYGTIEIIPIADLLFCSRIDMKQNNGAGKVVRRMTPLMDHARLSGIQMMACKHANGKDWWLLKQGKDSNTVYRFLFKQDTILGPFVQTFSKPDFGIAGYGGQIVFSQDGSKYAATNRASASVFIADFDRCTGLLSNPQAYPVPSLNIHNPYDDTATETQTTSGVAFSPNGRFIYVSRYYNMQQLDLDAADSAGRWVTVAGLDTTWDEFQEYSSIYIAPDSKIYIGNRGSASDAMSVIDSPDNKGLACHFCPRCMLFPAWYHYNTDTHDTDIYHTAGTPPCMPNYGLGALPGGCPTEVAQVTVSENFGIFPNPTTGSLNITYDLSSDEKGVVEIGDLLGQHVQTIALSNEKQAAIADLNKYASGVYYYRYLVNGEQRKTGKIILQK